MEPDFMTRMLLTVAALVAAVWVVRLGIAIPKLGLFMLLVAWLLGCSVVAMRWDLTVGWVIAGSVAGLVVLGCVVMVLIWLYDWWQRQS